MYKYFVPVFWNPNFHFKFFSKQWLFKTTLDDINHNLIIIFSCLVKRWVVMLRFCYCDPIADFKIWFKLVKRTRQEKNVGIVREKVVQQLFFNILHCLSMIFNNYFKHFGCPYFKSENHGEFSTYYFHVKTKISADYYIYIIVFLRLCNMGQFQRIFKCSLMFLLLFDV